MLRKLAVVLAAVVASVVWIAPAVAAPPTLLSVGHVKRQPKATWSLAPGAALLRLIEAA